MNNSLLPLPDSSSQVDKPGNRLSAAGEAANRAAAEYVFDDYRQRRAKKTLRTQTAALRLWVQYLVEVSVAHDLLVVAEAWATVYFPPKEREVFRQYAELSTTIRITHRLASIRNAHNLLKKYRHNLPNLIQQNGHFLQPLPCQIS